MATTIQTQSVEPVRKGASSSAASDVVVGGLLLAALTTATCWLLGLPTSHLLLALSLYLGIGTLVLLKLPPPSPGPGVGPANRVTLGRATLVVAVTALALRLGPLGEVGYWWVLALATVGMALDGLDGRVARNTRSEGAFGARFDMEVDALLLMALSALVWQSGKVGGWVLLIGGIRYLFVLAGMVWPALQAPLPASFRRKTVCVVQGIALIVCVAPIISVPLATTAAAVSLLSLLYSFAVDVRWLVRVRPQESRATLPVAPALRQQGHG